MATLEFRPPQFSEDTAWLPAWLQQFQAEPLSKLARDTQMLPEHASKDLVLQENIFQRKDASLLSTEEGGYNNCHLLLSGEEDSSVKSASSLEQVLHFHLHLSSDACMPSIQNSLQGELPELNDILSMQKVESSALAELKADQCWKDYTDRGVNLLRLSSCTGKPDQPDLLLVRSQAKLHESKDVLSIQQVETSSLREELVGQFKMDDSFCAVTSEPNALGNAGPQSVTGMVDFEEQREENLDAKCSKDPDVHHAVELSIAASEALVIHQLFKSGSSSETFSAAAVLEVSLRVKQARSEGLEDFLLSLSKEEEIDCLSDLDEISMADAFEDVGLSAMGSDVECACDSVVQVNETPIAGNLHGYGEKIQIKVDRVLEDDFVDNSAQKVLDDDMDKDIQLEKDFSSENIPYGKQNKLSDDPTLDLNTSSAVDPTLRKSVQEKVDDLAVKICGKDISQIRGYVYQNQVITNSSSQACNKRYTAGCKVNSAVPNRFQSRWLGGWTEKEVDKSLDVGMNDTKSIHKAFVGETSFLSESADVAPDQNSFVQKNESMLSIASQASVHFESLCEKKDYEILHSQDIMKASSLCSVDPLCSVVPCSISSESAPSIEHQLSSQNAGEVAINKCFSPMSNVELENSHRNSDAKLVDKEREHVPNVNSKASESTIHRQLTSLKTYSMLSPGSDAFLGRVTVYSYRPCIMENMWRTRPFEQILDDMRSSGERERTVTKYARGRDDENCQKTSTFRDPITESANLERHSDETAILQALLPEGRKSPLISNPRPCHHLQASGHPLVNYARKGNPKCSAVETLVELQHSKKFPMRQSKSKDPCNGQVPMRKRVHFSDAEVQLQQNTQLHNQKPANKNILNFRTSKRLKPSNSWSDAKTREVKSRLTNLRIKGNNSNRLVFQGIEFLLTGFSSRKEIEIEGLVRKFGGIILPDIPSCPPSSRRRKRTRSKIPQIPVVLCSKKLQTTKFLYGCAVNAYILYVNWLMDSIAAGSVLPPEKYMILSNQADGKCTENGKPVHFSRYNYIFEQVGIMFHGKHSFCTKLAKIFKHGGGTVFKTLHWLVHGLDSGKISVGAIVAEDKNRVSRHLRHCALEQKIPMMSAGWIINSLYVGKLLPFTDDNYSLSAIENPEFPIPMELSEEI